MAIYSPLRSRRLTARQAESTERLITFQLREETFALPLIRVYKVTTLDRLYGDVNQTGVSLTTYQGRELVVIDIAYKVFGHIQPVLSPLSQVGSEIATEDLPVRYLLIIAGEDGQLVGLPIDSAPSIQTVPTDAFRPLPDIYRHQSQIHCVSSISIDTPNRPAIFLLDPALMLKS